MRKYIEAYSGATQTKAYLVSPQERAVAIIQGTYHTRSSVLALLCQLHRDAGLSRPLPSPCQDNGGVRLVFVSSISCTSEGCSAPTSWSFLSSTVARLPVFGQHAGLAPVAFLPPSPAIASQPQQKRKGRTEWPSVKVGGRLTPVAHGVMGWFLMQAHQ